ncbi:uncharacterized protein LOC104582775 [Brachypodium distachyon]|uniref:uncharacterized protein LOC104582775 n=1 Tax=Brachypodium distachyon TaxID=15368 RepID=UPI000D0DEDD1|nr:uncharacterized protein LOC104582775 [Brachypodium distachyon]|eukprot:XP_014754101.2 uncharacterized protein LOC104582775 [Brachypodium distachyon]
MSTPGSSWQGTLCIDLLISTPGSSWQGTLQRGIPSCGSPIEMTGPKRGISFDCSVLVEFDMRIKKGKEEDDVQLIDGAVDFNDVTAAADSSIPFTTCFEGDYGAVHMTYAMIDGVEATIEVIISKVQSGFNLSLSSFVFMKDSHEKIQLFRGTIGESCGLRRFVIAVEKDTWMHMKLEVGQNSSNLDHYYCSFKTDTHGCACQEIMLDLATISVKATWSTLP